MTDGCIAEQDDGQHCGRPAPLFDLERQGMVCVDHASLTAGQRRLIANVLRTLVRAMDGGQASGAARRDREAGSGLD